MKVASHTQTSGVDAGVHEGRHAEVGQDEEEDEAIVERHERGDHLGQPGAPEGTNGNNGQFLVFFSVMFTFAWVDKRPAITVKCTLAEPLVLFWKDQ